MQIPATIAWIERMLAPEQLGDFESLASLEPTLAPIFAREVGPRFLAWDAANAEARKNDEPQAELSIQGAWQGVQHRPDNPRRFFSAFARAGDTSPFRQLLRTLSGTACSGGPGTAWYFLPRAADDDCDISCNSAACVCADEQGASINCKNIRESPRNLNVPLS